MPEESGQETIETIKPLTIELSRASLEFNQLLLEAAKSDGIDPILTRQVKVLVPEKWIKQGLSGDTPLNKLTEFARTQKDINGVTLPSAVYSPGIGGGIGPNERSEYYSSKAGTSELRVAATQEYKLSRSAEIFPEEKFEADRTSTDFLVDGGYGVVVYLQPPKESPYSSISADASATKTILNLLRGERLSPDVVCWSNGGFKETQAFLFATEAVAGDLDYAINHYRPTGEPYLTTDQIKKIQGDPSQAEGILGQVLFDIKILRQNEKSLNLPDQENQGRRQPLWFPVFATGYDALQFINAHRDSNILISASPINASELAYPVPAGGKTPLKRIATDATRLVINTAITSVGHHEDFPFIDFIVKKFPPDTQTLVYRLLEMGRGKREVNIPETSPVSPTLYSLTKTLIQESLGKAAVGVLIDRSGNVVDPTQGGVFKILIEILTPMRVIGLQSQSIPHQERASGRKIIPRDEHGLLKHAGILETTLAWANALKFGLVSPSTPDTRTGSFIMPVTTTRSGTTDFGLVKWQTMQLDFEKYSDLANHVENLSPQETIWLYRLSKAITNGKIGGEELTAEPEYISRQKNPAKKLAYGVLNALIGPALKAAVKGFLGAPSEPFPKPKVPYPAKIPSNT